MKKETIRPLLVEAIAKAQAKEGGLARPEEERLSNWESLADLLEARQEARLKRAQAELQLWLADRQWEREEAGERDTLPPPSASPAGKA